ncbi:transglutaminase family protein [Teichococcus aestuarii]|uniref:transglutaminase family protein n=1 Tax=Teichococcus aestuarii TaxID=568898 RepID=UPI00361D8E62
MRLPRLPPAPGARPGMTLFNVRHLTEYRYAKPVRFGEHRLMFRPRDSHDQRLLEATLAVDPEPAELRWIHDVFGNCVALLRFGQPATRLSFDTRIRLEHTPQHGPAFRTDTAALTYPFAYDAEDLPDLLRTMAPHHPDPGGEVARWARQFIRPGRPSETGHLLMTLCYAIRESFSYARRTEPGTQPPLQTLHLRRGTCRDFALLMMEAVRHLGFAARFVTGYVYVPDRDGSATLGGGSTHALCRSTCPAPGGWSSTRPTASSATGT